MTYDYSLESASNRKLNNRLVFCDVNKCWLKHIQHLLNKNETWLNNLKKNSWEDQKLGNRDGRGSKKVETETFAVSCDLITSHTYCPSVGPWWPNHLQPPESQTHTDHSQIHSDSLICSQIDDFRGLTKSQRASIFKSVFSLLFAVFGFVGVPNQNQGEGFTENHSQCDQSVPEGCYYLLMENNRFTN